MSQLASMEVAAAITVVLQMGGFALAYALKTEVR